MSNSELQNGLDGFFGGSDERYSYGGLFPFALITLVLSIWQVRLSVTGCSIWSFRISEKFRNGIKIATISRSGP